MSLSQLALEIKESPTLALNEKARILREKGEAVVHLGAGEPKSKVPIDAILGCAAKLTTGEIRYTPTEGIPSLVKAIVRYTEDNYNKIVGPAYKDVAKKYKGQKGIEAKLVEKVLKGGKGSWGEVPMPANSQVNEAEAKQLVQWILTLK